MFIGHYGPALAAKPIEQRLPLWLLFLAVQWLDIGWSALVMLECREAAHRERIHARKFARSLLHALHARTDRCTRLFWRIGRDRLTFSFVNAARLCPCGCRRSVFSLAAGSGRACARSASARRFLQGRLRPLAPCMDQFSARNCTDRRWRLDICPRGTLRFALWRCVPLVVRGIHGRNRNLCRFRPGAVPHRSMRPIRRSSPIWRLPRWPARSTGPAERFAARIWGLGRTIGEQS